MNSDAYLANAIRVFQSHTNNPDECACRCVIHAAYYSVFHLVCARMNLNVIGTDIARHSDAKRALLAYVGTDRCLSEARLHFATLQRYRVDADYSLTKKISAREAQECLTRAKQIFKAADIDPAPS